MRPAVSVHVSLHVAILFLLTFSTSLLEAQFRASLRGTVSDPEGAAIPGATVTLVNTDTNQSLTAGSDGNGIYEFNALAPAPYKLTVSATGFKQKVLDHVQIIPEQLNALNLQLEVGEAKETVTVSGTTQTLDTETATVSGTINSEQIQHMPSFNRDVFQLAQLAPGVFGDASQASSGGSNNLPGTQGPGGSSASNAGIFATENGPQVSSAGGQYETNGISIDGISTASAVWGGTSVITPSEDSVQDLKVVSNSYDAENGRFSGAQIQVTTKSGTNQLHGSAFFKASRPGLNAYQRWNGVGSNVSGTPAKRGLNRNDSRFNNYGGSLGGPLWKNKIFAFFNWETSPFSSVATAQGWYETPQFDALAPAGSIAAKYLSFPGNAPSANAIISRTCASIGLSEGVNCITTNGGLNVGSPITTGLGNQDLTYGGSATSPGVGGGLTPGGVPDIAFFNTLNPTTISQNQYNGRVDANLTEKDRLSFALYWVPLDSTFYNSTIRPENLWHHSQINDAFSVIWNHTFSPSLLNQARFNAAGWRWNELASNSQEPFGLPQDAFGLHTDTSCAGSACAYGTAQLQAFGAPGPSELNQWTYTWNDVLTKIIGRHSIKTGFEYTRLSYLNYNLYASRPGYYFENIWDFLNDAPYFENGGFNHVTGVPGPVREDDREQLWGVFVQDDIKLRSNLTVNLGLRWSYFGALYAKQNNQDVLQFGPGADALTGMSMRVGGNLYTPQKNNFGPVVGFTYAPGHFHDKIVFRGGLGIAYNQNEIAITATTFGNPPNSFSVAFTCPFTTFAANPSCAGTGILYQTAGDVHSIFGFAPNPATITTFGSNNLPICPAPCATPGSVTGFPASPKTITTYHYSFDMQDQIAANWVFTLGYQGNETRHLLVQSNFNAIGAAYGFPMNPAVSTVTYYQNGANSNYNAMVTTLTHNFSRTFQASAQYTWARAMDENSGPYYQDYYPFATSAAYGRSNYDARNAFKLFGLWQPVFFHGSHNWIEKVVGGWSLSGILNLHSGFPWDPIYNTTESPYYVGSGYGQLRPVGILPGAGTDTSNSTFMQATNPNYHGNASQYFVAPTYTGGATFPATTPAPPVGIHRNSLNGPGYNDVDLSLAKAFGLPNNKVLGERARFEIRADVYNFFNKLNLDVTHIDGNLGSVAPDGTVTPNSDFGVAGAALGSRTVQLQARFSF